ncbi:helix-turn-helix domain-containing protein [Solirhodobacter olei]|uniref:helix-turn-helix domain-containing protein n=1 Tax=Solirhodobacter olei TaxID=2493082 RepID=UPI0019D4B7B2|nr:helix-turn-helix transcriptional regulator [Solirhodobacter olei]
MSSEPAHYPDVDRPVIAMAKEFAANTRTGRHGHVRAQLIHAIEGLMVATTDHGTWVVPPGFALWVPPGIRHDVAMHGSVSMRTVYVRSAEAASLPDAIRVVAASALLQAALVSLSADPPAYDERKRGGHLAALILDEIARAPATPFALPVPEDQRLAKLARALIRDPGAALDINGWADEIGVSRRTLTRLFRAQTGISFGTWRRRLRLMRALERSADGTPLARAAAGVGYRSLPAFRTMARKEFGADFEAVLGSRRPAKGSHS